MNNNKMKKVLMTWAAVLCCWVTLSAQQLTEQQAMERALQYMNSGKASANARRMAAPANGGSMKLKTAPVEARKIYAFNMEGGGFVIASADQRTLPVLGYSTTGSIDWEQMPENMRSWLKQYDEAIATLGHRRDFRDGEQMATLYGEDATTARQSRRAKRTAVEPLIKTHWDQSAPYWNQVPTYQGPEPNLRNKQCYVGCVATAMAQVMNYWQWPKMVSDGLPDYDCNIQYNNQNYTWHLGALPPTRFEWELMINDYRVWNTETQQYDPLGTDEQRKAVATLMRYCGQSVKMTYRPRELGGSAAYTNAVAIALVNYFDYSTAQYIMHHFFGIDEWEEIIYGELAAGRPIVYSGASESSGHAFVCDGYDGEGMFHINWGWSGQDDGYFALAVLNPYNNTGSGSGSSGIGFCIDEGAVIYTDPHMAEQPSVYSDFKDRFYQFDPICLYDNNFVAFSYTFFETYNEVADHAFGTIDSEGNLQPLFMVDPNDSIVYSYTVWDYNWFLVQIDPSRFTPGQTETLYPMLRFRHPGEQWQVIPPMEQNLTVGCDKEGHFFMRSNQKSYDMQLTGIGITKGTGRLGERSDVTIRVRNNEKSDYNNKLYLLPVYLGHIKPEEYETAPDLAQGQQMQCGAYIPAGGEAEVTFSFVPEYGGTVVFFARTENRYFGETHLILNNDTLTNYNAYVENKSYLSRDGDQWYWNIELADRIGVKMSHWVPSDNLYLRARHYLNDEQVKSVRDNTGLKEYLAALPDSIGTGNYTFTYQMPIEVGQPGEYYFDSYLAEIVNEERVSYCCANIYSFTIDDITGIKEIYDLTIGDLRFDSDAWFDLQGRRLTAKPTHRGLYIQGNKKILIR
ncbi:MAG: C10 family peptidase [Bacteroidaceae bacterium]|nr:C10 family peptidase [Bacteroidaceae bacterium]